jgi:hypothetical protein
MTKHSDIVISQVSVPQINLNIDTRFTPNNANSAPNNQMYPVDDINEPIPCTLLYVKGRMLRTIKIVDAIVMASRIMHDRPIPSQCAVVEETTIRECREFEDLDYLDEEEGIEKLKDTKGNFVLWSHKNIILNIHFSSIVLPQNKEDEVLQLRKTPYTTLSDLLFHLKSFTTSFFSNYPSFSSKFTTCTSSSASFSTTCCCSKFSSSHYPSSSKSLF